MHVLYKMKDYKGKMITPTIKRTPSIAGAQFSFKELLFEAAELEV